MKRHSQWPWLEAMVRCFLPTETAEAVLGDLAEECSIRSASTSSNLVRKWCWNQAIRSIPRLLWVSVWEGAWRISLAVALCAYVVASAVEFAATEAMSRLLAPAPELKSVVDLSIGLVAFGIAAYFATRLRPGSAVVLAFIVAAVVAVLMATMPDTAPTWYATSFLTVGPLVTILGGVIGAAKGERTAAGGER